MVWHTFERRFRAKYIVDDDSGCWQWTAAVDPVNGYGRFSDWQDGRTRSFWAHRVSYELHVGPIDEGLVIDHLCRNHACVNPDHLEPVPQRLNVIRGDVGKLRERTHCNNGHEWADGNEQWNTTPRGHRVRRCRQCHADAAKRSYNKVGRETRRLRHIKPPESDAA